MLSLGHVEVFNRPGESVKNPLTKTVTLHVFTLMPVISDSIIISRRAKLHDCGKCFHGTKSRLLLLKPPGASGPTCGAAALFSPGKRDLCRCRKVCSSPGIRVLQFGGLCCGRLCYTTVEKTLKTTTLEAGGGGGEINKSGTFCLCLAGSSSCQTIGAYIHEWGPDDVLQTTVTCRNWPDASCSPAALLQESAGLPCWPFKAGWWAVSMAGEQRQHYSWMNVPSRCLSLCQDWPPKMGEAASVSKSLISTKQGDVWGGGGRPL